MSEPIMDFPAAWEFVRSTKPEDHHKRCSWRTENGALLCDCSVVWIEYGRREARASADATITVLREALKAIAAPGCDASDWANDAPNVWDRCLDPDYVEGLPDGRCGPCSAHEALSSQAAQEDHSQRRRPLASSTTQSAPARNAPGSPPSRARASLSARGCGKSKP